MPTQPDELRAAMTEQRAAFEAWADDQGYPLSILGSSYFDLRTQGAWDAWQASAERLSALPAGGGWKPIESAPKDGTPFLAWYPKMQLDDDGDQTGEAIGGGAAAIVSCKGKEWDEPQWLDAHGAYYFDDWCFAEAATHWQPLPAAPQLQEEPK